MDNLLEVQVFFKFNECVCVPQADLQGLCSVVLLFLWVLREEWLLLECTPEKKSIMSYFLLVKPIHIFLQLKI